MRAKGFRSVAKMPDACENHGEPKTIGRGDDFRVTNGTTWLNHGRRARLCSFFHTVRKWKESIGCNDASSKRQLRFHNCNFDGIHAAHLAGTDSQRLAVASENNCVGFYVLANLPREPHGVALGVAWSTFGDNLQL